MSERGESEEEYLVEEEADATESVAHEEEGDTESIEYVEEEAEIEPEHDEGGETEPEEAETEPEDHEEEADTESVAHEEEADTESVAHEEEAETESVEYVEEEGETEPEAGETEPEDHEEGEDGTEPVKHDEEEVVRKPVKHEEEESETESEEFEKKSMLGMMEPEFEEEQYVDVNSLPLRPPQPLVLPPKPARRPWHPIMWDDSIVGGLSNDQKYTNAQRAEESAGHREYPHKQRIRNLRKLIAEGKVKPDTEMVITFLCNKFAMSDDRRNKLAATS